jgi:hypothetical protein
MGGTAIDWAAVIDNGISDKPGLHGPSGYRVVHAENLINGGSRLTHMAMVRRGGIVGGTGGQSQGTYTGVAPYVNLINFWSSTNRLAPQHGNCGD